MEENIKDSGEFQIYELGYHLLPNIEEATLQQEVAKIQSSISENEGVIISEGFPEIINLAYSMTKRVETKNLSYDKAFFGWIKFEISREFLVKIKNSLDSNSNVLRFLITKTVRENTMYTPKSQMMKRDTRDEVVVGEVVAKEKIEMSEEEMDKSIEELVVN